MDHIGIDVHKKHSQICILSGAGELIERRIRTEPEQFAEVLGARPRANIVIESATESEWVARCLEALGHQVIVADPNFDDHRNREPFTPTEAIACERAFEVLSGARGMFGNDLHPNQ